MSEKGGFCPTCGIPWPNFCPIDGKRLSGAWTCANAPKPVIRSAPKAEPAAEAGAPEPVAERAPSPREVPAAQAAAPEAPRAAADEGARRKPDASLIQSFVDSVASRASKKKKEGGRRRSPDPRQAATVIHPQLTEEEIKKAKARAEQRAAEAEPAPEKPKRRKRDGFSDTQWFMKGLSLEVADPETGAVVVDEQDYQVDESIPETERRKFTLRKKGEE